MCGPTRISTVCCVIVQAAGGLRETVRRRPVLVFAVLVLALSWPALTIGGSATWSSVTLLGHLLGPGAGAFLIAWLADGAAGVRELAGRALRWRAPVRWYLFVLFGVPAAYLLVGIVPYAVILTWVFNRTGRSVVLVTLMHAAGNAWNAFVYGPVFGVDPVLFEHLRVGVFAVIAIVLVVLTRGRLGSDLHHISGRRSGASGATVPPHGRR